MQFRYRFNAVLKLARVEYLVTAKGNLFHSDGPLWLKRAAHDLFIGRVCFSRTPQPRVFDVTVENPKKSGEKFVI